MLKPQVDYHPASSKLSLAIGKPFFHGTGNVLFAMPSRPTALTTFRKAQNGNKIKAALTGHPAETYGSKPTINVKAIVTLKRTKGFGFDAIRDRLTDILSSNPLLVELVSADLEPETGVGKMVKGYGRRSKKTKNEVIFEYQFKVSQDFGEVGAIAVENEYHQEIFLQNVELQGLPNCSITITCESWIHSKYDTNAKRVFFSNKSYLPFETPSGLKKLREEELKILQGFYYRPKEKYPGDLKYEKYERIYDYDAYNDLGQDRPILGGKEHPYPRRCRTRPRLHGEHNADQTHEGRSKGGFYVPRDEAFSDVKQKTFSSKLFSSLIHAVIPSIDAVFAKDAGFSDFKEINSIYDTDHNVPSLGNHDLLQVLPILVEGSEKERDFLLHFESPETLRKDQFFWLRDDEFARETLAGTNPYSIQLVKEWPLKSDLNPEMYGAPESAITTEIIEQEIKGYKSVNEAIQQKKLFILDYHDLLLPYVEKVRQLEGKTLYGSRTLFLLNEDGTLKPLAIELTRPPIKGKPQWKQVFKPSTQPTECWLWRLAKAHVLAHDSCHH